MKIVSGAVKGIVSALLLASMAGCYAHVPLADPAKDTEAKQFHAKSSEASIYVYRPKSAKGGAILFQVSLDGKLCGQIASGSFYELSVTGGKHTVSAISGENTATVDVACDPGKLYFVRDSAKFGAMTARTKLESVDDATGRQEIQSCSLAAGNGAQ